MQVIEFEEKYRRAFIDFNTDWIESYFDHLEAPDLELFQNIDKEIAAGAMIFFAVEHSEPLATCMTRPIGTDVWEICKLGSNAHLPHRGAGSAVFKAAMDWALSHGARRLFILTNSRLKAAMHIYEKFGFNEVKLDDYEYDRGDIAFEYIRG